MEITLKNSKERLLHLVKQFKTELSPTKTLSEIENIYKQYSGKKSYLVNISKPGSTKGKYPGRNLMITSRSKITDRKLFITYIN